MAHSRGAAAPGAYRTARSPATGRARLGECSTIFAPWNARLLAQYSNRRDFVGMRNERRAEGFTVASDLQELPGGAYRDRANNAVN